jgi:hypothetical protein
MTDASGEVGLLVVGMHRSGTSAVAGTLAALGLATPEGDDVLASTQWNERGFFESKRLIAVNNHLLAILGGTWTAPPTLPSGWERRTELDDLRQRAGEAFRRTFPRRPLAWKDPRTCITLPFWRTVVAGPLAAVFVYRDPVEVARSIDRRGDAGYLCALALWDRYVRDAAANLVDLPVLAVDYAHTLEEPAAWVDELVDFLQGVGIGIDRRRKPAARATIDPAMRHRRQSSGDGHPMSDIPRQVFETLRHSGGVHDRWQPIDLGVPPDWVGEVLALRLEADKLTRMERILQTSRAFAATRFMRRLRSGRQGAE